ncbi:MAG: VOC family protein [Syntrophomonas sp.]
MNKYGLIFHHLGLATQRFKDAQIFLMGMGYKINQVVYDPLQKVNLCLCENENMPTIEIIFSFEETSPIHNIISTKKEMIYHTCYETDDLNTSISLIKSDKNRIITVSGPTKAILFDNRLVSFHYIKGFGLIEILQREVSN